tara:strand:- start:1290 stop:1637 length:348 start_codon:yes stop_codon:yes gene_type:complete
METKIMTKIRFLKITNDDLSSVHDMIPALQSSDVLIRIEYGADGRLLDTRPIQFAGSINVEPTFTLRAQDIMSTPCVGVWIAIAEASGVVPIEKIISAKSTLEAMKVWEPTKVPD